MFVRNYIAVAFFACGLAVVAAASSTAGTVDATGDGPVTVAARRLSVTTEPGPETGRAAVTEEGETGTGRPTQDEEKEDEDGEQLTTEVDDVELKQNQTEGGESENTSSGETATEDWTQKEGTGVSSKFEDEDQGGVTVETPNKDDQGDEDEDDKLSIEAEIAKGLDMYGGLTVLVVGTVGNCLSIAVLTRKQLRQTITGQYLIALAFCDLWAIVIGQAGRHVPRTFFKDDIPSRINWYCKAWYFGFYMGSTYSSWILAAVSVERCLAVSLPLQASAIFSRKRAKIYLLLMLLVITAYNSHMFISYQVNRTDTNSTICGINAKNYFVREIRPWADFTFKAITPGIVIVMSNSIIIYRLYQIQKQRNKSLTECHGAESSHLMAMVPMLVTISVAFLCLTSPIHVTYVINAFYPAVYEDTAMRLIWSVNVLCLYINHAINFFLYVISGREFRTELINMLLCRERRSKFDSNNSFGSQKYSSRA